MYKRKSKMNVSIVLVCVILFCSFGYVFGEDPPKLAFDGGAPLGGPDEPSPPSGEKGAPLGGPQVVGMTAEGAPLGGPQDEQAAPPPQATPTQAPTAAPPPQSTSWLSLLARYFGF